MALIQEQVAITGTGSATTATLYTVPANRNLYVRWVSLRTNGAMANGDFMDLEDTTTTFRPLKVWAATGAIPNSYINMYFGEHGICIPSGDPLVVAFQLPNSQLGTAYMEGIVI